MLEIKGYITNLGKYNEGELIGEWITFPIDEEDLDEVFKRIGMNYDGEDGKHIDVGYEEYFFTDWDCDFDLDFGEYEEIGRVNELAEELKKWDKDIFKAVCEYEDVTTVLESEPDEWILSSDVRDYYDLGYMYAVDYGAIDFGGNEILERYFDFESYGRDIALEANGGFTNFGWIEYVG